MINFKPSFDVSTLCGLSTVNCATEILKNTTDDVVKQTDLVKLVSQTLDMSDDSVRGTLLGGDLTPPKHKLRGTSQFIKNWALCKTSNNRVRFVRKSSNRLDDFEVVKPTYDTPSKASARERRCVWCIRQIETETPKVLTLAGPEALDVQAMLKHKPNAEIFNVDTNAAVLEKSAALGLPMTNHHMDISKFIRKTSHLDLLNYDTDGYFGKKLVDNLRYINKKYLANYIAMTIHGHERIRNHGQFSNNFRAKYGNEENAISKYLINLMSNYDLLDEFIYHRNENKVSPMRTMIFKLHPDKLQIVTDWENLLTF